VLGVRNDGMISAPLCRGGSQEARQGMCPGEWETMEKFLSNKGSPGEFLGHRYVGGCVRL